MATSDARQAKHFLKRCPVCGYEPEWYEGVDIDITKYLLVNHLADKHGWTRKEVARWDPELRAYLHLSIGPGERLGGSNMTREERISAVEMTSRALASLQQVLGWPSLDQTFREKLEPIEASLKEMMVDMAVSYLGEKPVNSTEPRRKRGRPKKECPNQNVPGREQSELEETEPDLPSNVGDDYQGTDAPA